MASSKQPPALEQASVQTLQDPLESLQTFQQQTLDNINMVQSKIQEILKVEDAMTSAVWESEGLSAILEFFQMECFRLREINTKLQKEIAELTKGDSSPEQNHEQTESEKNK
ncbi:coiled-coil domain-containing protein 110 [Melanerpes formicivorus]|uniref:coiled-coil domain-containing protein 110 n=1 Tax=Melanerpes formicivorus TaxID=211600 RepID=UPI00358F9439